MENYSKAGPGLPVSHRGPFFFLYPSRHRRENQNSADVTRADWSSASAPERAFSQWWQASLELSVRPWRWGRAAGRPRGPISAGVPRKGPSNSPIRRRSNLASTGFTHASPPPAHWSRLIVAALFLNSVAKPQSCIFNHRLPIGATMEMSTTAVLTQPSYQNRNGKGSKVLSPGTGAFCTVAGPLLPRVLRLRRVTWRGWNNKRAWRVQQSRILEQ